MTPKANCTGSKSQNRSTCSNQTSDTSAACWVFSTSSRRPSSYCCNAPSTVGARCMASARAIASSIASLVPEPIEKCAVALASPSSTMLSLTQRLLRIIGKLRHIERLVSSGWPSRNQPKICAIRPADCFSLRPSRPCALEGCGIRFKNPGRASHFILIGVGDERTPFGLLKNERKSVERPGRAHPGEFVGTKVHLGLEVLGELVAEATVDTIGQHDEVCVGKASDFVDVGFEHQVDAEFARPLLQNSQQLAVRT